MPSMAITINMLETEQSSIKKNLRKRMLGQA